MDVILNEGTEETTETVVVADEGTVADASSTEETTEAVDLA